MQAVQLQPRGEPDVQLCPGEQLKCADATGDEFDADVGLRLDLGALRT